MKLTPAQKDRAAGVLLGQAIGDALGVPYEFRSPITEGTARMIGGGLGPYAPGEWSDDTQMAICIARVTATGAELLARGGHNCIVLECGPSESRLGFDTSFVPHDGSTTGQESPAHYDGSTTGQESPVHDGSTTDGESPAADSPITGQESPAADGPITGHESPAADGPITGQESPAADGSTTGQDSPAHYDGSTTRRAGLDQIAKAFIDWRWGGATDIGNQTAAVLSMARAHAKETAEYFNELEVDLPETPWADVCRSQAEEYANNNRRSAGNGALMRGGIVGLTRLSDREATARAARAVAALTHADPLAVESCVLLAESVRVAVLEGRLDPWVGTDMLSLVDEAQWDRWIAEAETGDPKSFSGNGFTVTAFQAAWAAILSTDTGEPGHPERALQRAVAIGHDTDTVAAIAGALLGARYGVSGLPWRWRRDVHGWPGMRGADLISLSLDTALRGVGEPAEPWPLVDRMASHHRPLGVPHPADERVVLGTEADLARPGELGCTAVVSLSRIGRAEILDPTTHVEQWLVDSDDPETNQDLIGALNDAADAVAGLVAEGHRVLLHCVRAEHRTPSVALVYAVKHCGVDPEQAAADIRKALNVNTIGGLLWATAMEEAKHHVG